jgi:hypothetical protein
VSQEERVGSKRKSVQINILGKPFFFFVLILSALGEGGGGYSCNL